MLEGVKNLKRLNTFHFFLSINLQNLKKKISEITLTEIFFVFPIKKILSFLDAIFSAFVNFLKNLKKQAIFFILVNLEKKKLLCSTKIDPGTFQEMKTKNIFLF